MRPQKYLKKDRRTGNWVYRREYPKDLGDIEGIKTFVRSLGTTDLALANRQWSTFDAEFEAKVKQARSLAVYRQSKDERRTKFWLSVARWIAFERESGGGQLTLAREMHTPTMHLPSSHSFVILRNNFLNWARQHDSDAAAVYKMGDTRLDTLFECGLIGSFFVAVETQKIEKGVKSALPAGTGTKLTEVLERFKAEKRRNVQTYADMVRAIVTFECACGGEAPTVETTTKEHMQKFREYLVKQEDWRGRTKNKVRANLSSLYGHAKTLFLIDQNPVEMVATFDQDDSEKRKAFTDTDLKAIFSSNSFIMETRPSRWWIPVLSLYVAARLGEIGQLDRKDVYEDPDTGIWTMSITKEGAEQNAKNEGSVRFIPVPEAVLKLGFIDFVKTVKSGPLFGIKRSPSGAFPSLSNDLNDTIRDAGIIDPLKVFHSYRHTTRTKARSFEIPEETMDFISGHASVNVGRKYGTHEILALKKFIDRIEYPVSIPVWQKR